MVEIKHRATRLDEVRIQRSIPKLSVTAERTVLGGAGWRPGVPHILLYAGDTPGASAWPLSQDLAYPVLSTADNPVDYYLDAEILDWSPAGYVQPLSPRGGTVHINAFKTSSAEYRVNQRLVWVSGAPGSSYGSWEYVDVDLYPYLYQAGSERFGHIGDWWLGDPESICTTDQALRALADLDINVACIDGSTAEDIYGIGNVTLEELNRRMTRPDLLDADVRDYTQWFRQTGGVGDGWELGGFNLGIEGAGIAHLTGAVDDDGRNLGWSLFRQEGIDDEPIANLAARISADVLAHAARLGDDQSFDVGFLMDDSGSFGSSQSRATQAFLALIDSFRDAGRDIFVAVARYSDYGYRTHDNGGEEERPFSLQYPMAPVAEDAQRDALVHALVTTIHGNGGGDDPETQWEAFYQIASGVGIDANHNGSSANSGVAGIEGVPPLDISEEFYELYNGPDAYESSVGTGWQYPGWSGDVPPFNSVAVTVRGDATVTDHIKRTWVYGTGVE